MVVQQRRSQLVTFLWSVGSVALLLLLAHGVVSYWL